MSTEVITGPVAAGRRARQRELVRGRVYDAAIELFETSGYDATTIGAIADRADVARNTVFNHFPQKASFLQEWGRRRRLHTLAALRMRDADDESAAQQLRRCMADLAGLNISTRSQTVMLMDAAMRHTDIVRGLPLASVLTPIVVAGNASGEFTTPDPALAGVVLAGSYFTTVLRWIAVEPAPFDLAAQLDAMLDLVLTGLRQVSP